MGALAVGEATQPYACEPRQNGSRIFEELAQAYQVCGRDADRHGDPAVAVIAAGIADAVGSARSRRSYLRRGTDAQPRSENTAIGIAGAHGLASRHCV
jgi:hypothetical protein